MTYQELMTQALAWANDGRFPWTDFIVQCTEEDFEASECWMVLTAFHAETGLATLSVYIPEDSVTDFQLELE